MTSWEKRIWTTAFANAFESQRWDRMTTPGSHPSVDEISGYECAEIADLALNKYREAITSDSAGYLTIVKESRPGDELLVERERIS